MADEKFDAFKKKYKSGEIETATMPPLVPGPTGVGRMIGGAIATAGRRKLMDTLNKSKEKGQKARTPKEGRTGGTFTDKIKNTRTRERTPKEKEKFGPLVKREDKLPATQGSRALTVAREGKGDLQKYNPGGRSVATQGTRTFGDKGQSGRIVGLSTKGKLAIGGGAAAAAAAGYQTAQKSAAGKTDRESPQAGGGAKYAPRDDRASSGGSTAKAEDKKKKNVAPINRDNLSDKGKKVFDGRQGQAKSKDKKPSSPVAGRQSSGRSSGKASPFERQKQRMYEKEGYGGRSMTPSKAKGQVKKERGYKFKDLFKKK